MASPSAPHLSETDDMEVESPPAASSPVARVKQKATEKGGKTKVSQRSLNKKKFQSLIEQFE